MPVGNKFAESQGLTYVPNDAYLQDDFKRSTPLDFSNISSSGIMSQAPIPAPLSYIPQNEGGGGGGGSGGDDDDDDDGNKNTNTGTMSPMDALKNAGMFMINPLGFLARKAYGAYRSRQKAKSDLAADQAYKAQQEKDAIEMAANPNNPGGKPAAYNYAGRDNDQGTHTSTMSNEQAQSNQDAGRGGQYKADGGRVGYFFGGRVNYKAGGRVSFKNGGLASIL